MAPRVGAATDGRHLYASFCGDDHCRSRLIISIVSGTAGTVSVVNSARALGWQKRRDAERRQMHVTIHFGHAVADENIEPGALALPGGVENLPLDYRLEVIVVNESGHEAPAGLWSIGVAVRTLAVVPPKNALVI